MKTLKFNKFFNVYTTHTPTQLFFFMLKKRSVITFYLCREYAYIYLYLLPASHIKFFLQDVDAIENVFVKILFIASLFAGIIFLLFGLLQTINFIF